MEHAEAYPNPSLSEHLYDVDVHSSSDAYATRFGGEIGDWLLGVQSDALLSLLDDNCRNILDVGGGHAQTVQPLLSVGRSLTVLGSSSICSHRLQSYLENGTVSFQVGNLIDLPYNPRSFDAVMSFRILSHAVAWKSVIAELCRVAEHAVIVDYPLWCSVNLLSPLAFHLKKKVEVNTRHFKIFTNSMIKGEFNKHGFKLAKLKRQFFFPMALHRAHKSVAIAEMLEKNARVTGLTYLFGSPVVAKFVRK